MKELYIPIYSAGSSEYETLHMSVSASLIIALQALGNSFWNFKMTLYDIIEQNCERQSTIH